MPEIEVLVDCIHGRYCPQLFAERYADGWSYPSNLAAYLEDIAILKQGPDHEHYWEAWEAVQLKAVGRHDLNGHLRGYTIRYNGDVLAMPPGWDEEEPS